MAWASSGGYPGVTPSGDGGLNAVGLMAAQRFITNLGGELVVYDPNAVPLLRIEAGSANDGLKLLKGLGLFGATPPAAPTTGGAATAGGTYTAVEEAMLNVAYAALRSIGLVT